MGPVHTSSLTFTDEAFRPVYNLELTSKAMNTSRYLSGLGGREIDHSEGLYAAEYLNTTVRTIHPCHKWDTNPRPQYSSGPRRYVPSLDRCDEQFLSALISERLQNSIYTLPDIPTYVSFRPVLVTDSLKSWYSPPFCWRWTRIRDSPTYTQARNITAHNLNKQTVPSACKV
jgi:hypothetical protein